MADLKKLVAEKEKSFFNLDLDSLANKLVDVAGAGYTAKQSVKQAQAIAEQQRWIAADNSDPSIRDGVYDAASGGDSNKTIIIVGGVVILSVVLLLVLRK